MTAACGRITDHIRDRRAQPTTKSPSIGVGRTEADRADTDAAKPGITIVRTHLYWPLQR